MNKRISSLILAVIATSTMMATTTTDGARGVIQRLIGDRADDITISEMPSPNGLDVYEVNATDGRLEIGGSSQSAICYAFHKYLREACNSMTTWSGSSMQLPERWNDYCAKGSSPYKLRYFLNVCTYGYTAPYWDWARWESEIDWMALHGVNMPLASVAAEAIAERVWIKLGLTKEEVRDFFTAPAYLPWHRMGNLNKWDGPLSDEWQQSQIELQHKIIDRMRQLGMEPVAPAFAGFVPMAFAQKHPEIKCKHLRWGGFDESLNAFVLPPDSPFFETIGRMFIQEWEKEFGKATYYLSDSFNEMEIPLDPNDLEGKYALLANYGESIYNSIKAGNPDAVWVTQGWTFGYQHKFWTPESLKALLSRVPNDKMIIVDLGNDYPKWVWHTEQTWKNHDGFYGKGWIFSYVPNFGGKTLMTGELEMYATSSSEALHAPNKGNLLGFGSAPEGLENNEVVYEILADMGWTEDKIDLDSWLKDYCMARYHGYPEAMQQAWDLLRKSAYSSLYSYPRFTWQTVIHDQRRKSKTDFDREEFYKAVELFLSCASQLEGSELYRNDAIELAAYYAAAKADILYKRALEADASGNKSVASKLIKKVIPILLRIDTLLASHKTTSLEEWVRLARNYGATIAEKDNYEADAKRLITTWGGFQEDYAARFWNGLIKDYYVPRIKIYFSEERESLDSWEEQWINTPWTSDHKSYKNPVAEAQKLIKDTKSIK